MRLLACTATVALSLEGPGHADVLFLVLGDRDVMSLQQAGDGVVWAFLEAANQGLIGMAVEDRAGGLVWLVVEASLVAGILLVALITLEQEVPSLGHGAEEIEAMRVDGLLDV